MKKNGRAKRFACLAAVGSVAVVIIFVLFFAQAYGQQNSLPGTKGIKTNEDRVRYLEGYGWQVGAEPVSEEELLIPDEFDETYDQYLALQEDQGFDMTKYCGKRVKRYAYEITNYPTGENGVQIALLIYKNTVIGGEVLSSQGDDFIHGLTMPK